jgi:hypothetical protein
VAGGSEAVRDMRGVKGRVLRQFSEQMLSKLNHNFEEIDAWLTTLKSYLTEGEQQDAPDRSA